MPPFYDRFPLRGKEKAQREAVGKEPYSTECFTLPQRKHPFSRDAERSASRQPIYRLSTLTWPPRREKARSSTNSSVVFVWGDDFFSRRILRVAAKQSKLPHFDYAIRGLMFGRWIEPLRRSTISSCRRFMQPRRVWEPTNWGRWFTPPADGELRPGVG